MNELDEKTLISKGQYHVESVADDEIILMHVESGGFFSLGSTSRRIWELLEQPQTIDSLCECLIREFNVPREQCLADVVQLVIKLKERDLIDISRASAG
jgi:hypothetical protein